MNIYDIASLCGVSTATVSRVINGGAVRPETKARVLQVMEQTGFRPSAYARGMNLNTMKIVGILVSEINDLYYVKAVSALEKKLRENHYDIILYSTGEEIGNTQKYIRQMLDRKVDAIFTVGSIFHTVEDQLTTDGAVPIITINLETENSECYNVYCDDEAAVSGAVSYLYQKGHRHFLYLYDTETINGTKKLLGFKNGIRSCGLSADSQIILKSDRQIEAAKQLVTNALREHPEITGILTSVDELAAGAVKAAYDLKRKIPEELAIIGYDNSILSDCSTPRITSIDNKAEELCILGVNLFSDLQNKKTVAQKYILNCEMIQKQTT